MDTNDTADTVDTTSTQTTQTPISMYTDTTDRQTRRTPKAKGTPSPLRRTITGIFFGWLWLLEYLRWLWGLHLIKNQRWLCLRENISNGSCEKWKPASQKNTFSHMERNDKVYSSGVFVTWQWSLVMPGMCRTRAENLIRVSCIIPTTTTTTSSSSSSSTISYTYVSASSHTYTMVPLLKALCTGSVLNLPRSNLFFVVRDPRKSRRNSQPHNDTIRHSEQAIKELLMFSEPKLLLGKKWSFTAELQDFIAE